jgi:hypothetical protein
LTQFGVEITVKKHIDDNKFNTQAEQKDWDMIGKHLLRLNIWIENNEYYID